MSNLEIKNLMGSSTYGIRLEILETIEKLEDIFVRIEFFRARRKIGEIIVSNFESLIDSILNNRYFIFFL